MFFLYTSLRWFLTSAKECKCVNWEVVGGSMANSNNNNNRYMRTNEAKYSSEKKYQQSQLAELNVAFLVSNPC